MKSFLTPLLLATLLIPLAPSIKAQNNGAPLSMSLKQAQDYALLNNVSVKNARIDTDIARKKIWETTAIGLPQVSAAVNYQHQFKVPEFSFGSIPYIKVDESLEPGTVITSDMIRDKLVSIGSIAIPPVPLGVKNNTTMDVTLSQLLFNGAYIVGLQASRIYAQMSDQSLEKSESDIRESVANSYYLVLILEQNRDLLARSLQNIEKTHDELQKMYVQGFIENTDVDQVELVKLNLKNALSSLERQVGASYDLLKFQVGIPFESSLTLSDNLEQILAGVDLSSLLGRQFNIQNNINYKIITTSEELSKLNLKREQTGYLPTLAAVYRHSEKVNKPVLDFTPKDIVAVSLNIPIFSSGQRNVMVQQRRLELEKIRNTRENVAKGLQLEYINASNEFSTAYDKLLNEKKNLELTDRIYQKTLIKYKEGLSTSMDLTNANNQYITAQTNYTAAIFSVLSAKNKLDKLSNNQ